MIDTRYSTTTIGVLLTTRIRYSIYYGETVYKSKRFVGKHSLSDQFKMMIKRYKRVGYNMGTIRQSAWL